MVETIVDGTLEDAGNRAFQLLFDYISEKNRSHAKIAMTAPVSQKPAFEKIKMKSPISPQLVEGGWAVSFTMPVSQSIEALPAPEAPRVKLLQVSACRMAAVRYSGVWSEKLYLKNKQELKSWIENNGFWIIGEPVWARYNPPFTPWFLRRNEILIQVDTETN